MTKLATDSMITCLLKQPYTIVLVLIGLIVAIFKLLPNLSLTHNAAFFIILPPILFQAGLHLNLKRLTQDWKPITFLAIPGIMITTLLIAYPLSYVGHIPLKYTLLFGALISPTDPVSVLAIIRKINAPERLRTILEAESLFNDGTSVVLFMVILTMIQNNEPLNLGLAFFQFIVVTGGGALIGALCGYIIAHLIKIINNFLLKVILTILLAFSTPFIAESLHCSGIIAVILAGLIMGGNRFSGLNRKNRESMQHFWEGLDFIMNSIIFFMIGLQLQIIGLNNLINYKIIILSGIMIVLIARALIVYPTIYAYNRISKPIILPAWSHIIFWGGLRGTIPIILMNQLPDFEYKNLFQSMTFGIVIFSIIIQGLTIEPLLKRLKLQRI